MKSSSAKQLANCADWNLEMSLRFSKDDPKSAKRLSKQAKSLYAQAQAKAAAEEIAQD